MLKLNQHRAMAWILCATIVLSGAAVAPDGLRVGEQAPDFELLSVTGKKVTLRDFMSKGIVIVHFWKSK